VDVTRRKSNVKIGISGWSYPDWRNIVYPRGRGVNQLQFLAQFFPAIEINSTFYRIPSTNVVERWCADVSGTEDFTFTAKLFQDFTHAENKADVSGPEFSRKSRAFLQALQPLEARNRLGAVLIQFPYSFHLNSKNLDYLRHLLAALDGPPRVVEVRHRSFLNKEFFEFLRQCGAGFVNIDQPDVSYSIGPTAEATAPVAYVRFHGRNSAAWFKENTTRDERYDYSYTEDELHEWVHRVETLSNSAHVVYAMFNNHFRGQEVVNALEFLHLWSGNSVPAPDLLTRVYPRLKDIVSESRSSLTNRGTTLPLFPED
jgi:uncharacterized protein YecE (DUF72 family)